VTDHPHNPDDPNSKPLDPDNIHDDGDNDDFVEAIFVSRPTAPPTANQSGERYDLGWLFLCWAWEAGYRDWDQGVRALARALRGLQRTGLIERRTIKRAGRANHHGFALTDEGREAVAALSGDWIKGVDR